MAVEKWYRVEKYTDDVVAVDVIGSTERTLVLARGGDLGTERVHKVSEFATYYPVREDAVDHVVRRARERVAWARRAVAMAEEEARAIRDRFPDSAVWEEEIEAG